MDDFWIILTGALVASSCALLGCFLLLRKMTMVGDAISHAVLPGIVLAYLVAQTRASLPMLIGAALFGVLTTVLIEVLHKNGKLQVDAAIGVSFTWLFAIGVILITFFADKVDLDQECVLYGEIAYVPLDVWISNNGSNLGPISVWLMGANLLIVLAFVLIGYKGLLITSFDPMLAATVGISTAFWHYALMSAVSLTTVLSFESVGAILVVAFLIGPAATAYLLTENLRKMLFIAVGAGIVAAVGGYLLAVAVDGSIAGAMAACIGLEFMLAFLFAPQGGLLTAKQSFSKKDKQVVDLDFH
ncbi:manganese/zinc/iron transport system permease protein [Catalinimonas alkaloidigena]|uniref:metal ABC transporter permease n=1 Tax=Catalinimonas alkaloidigena TaxID=1075417 RepID=UPI0024058FEA|nr:metal ABC transporter permease [Catalinimonas alkaloidigena]MDF9795444.1 manganese/zinc/iron transport system permease protein [Catalinimonas alkaloidigena]